MTPSGSADRPVLVTGATGQVGSELVAALSKFVAVVAPSRDDMDLADANSIRQYLREVEPGLILNAAAYTSVDRAETESDLCMAVNAEAPRILAEEARDLDSAIIHFSTDYVFDGAKSGPYVETDPTAPLQVYGRSKEMGEKHVCAIAGAFMILRCSWVYSRTGTSFLKTMQRLREEKPELRIVNDQHGAPTWSREIARAVAEIVKSGNDGSRGLQDYVASKSGVYHLSASGSTTWMEFAQEIFNNSPGRKPSVVGISSEEFAAPAARPRNSIMSNAKIQRELGIAMPFWGEQLASCLASA